MTAYPAFHRIWQLILIDDSLWFSIPSGHACDQLAGVIHTPRQCSLNSGSGATATYKPTATLQNSNNFPPLQLIHEPTHGLPYPTARRGIIVGQRPPRTAPCWSPDYPVFTPRNTFLTQLIPSTRHTGIPRGYAHRDVAARQWCFYPCRHS